LIHWKKTWIEVLFEASGTLAWKLNRAGRLAWISGSLYQEGWPENLTELTAEDWTGKTEGWPLMPKILLELRSQILEYPFSK